MKTDLLEPIGDRNPQLYRELRGRITLKNLIVAIALSVCFQAFVLGLKSSEYSGFIFNWQGVFETLNWTLPIGAGAIGVYFLSRDLCREKDRGTLDFIRLSPQSSERILLGKILGVPILLYFALALALPLHLAAAILSTGNSSVPEIFLSLVSRYLAWLALCSIFYNLALLMVLMQKPVKGLNILPAINTACWLIVAPFILVLTSFFLSQLNSIGEERGWNWFFLPERYAYLWFLATLFALSLWLWPSLNRAFRNPQSSLIGKVQSYWIVGSTQLWMLGFALPDLMLKHHNSAAGWAILGLAISPIYVLLIAALLVTPLKVAPLDMPTIAEREVPKYLGFRQRYFEENPYTGGAILLDFAIVFTVWLPYFIACFFVK